LDAVGGEVGLAGPGVIGAKVAVSVIGPYIVTDAETDVPLNEPKPVPAQEMNEDPFQETKMKPLLGVASIGMLA